MFLFSHISFILAILLRNFFLSSKSSQLLSQCSDSSKLPSNFLVAQPSFPLSYVQRKPPPYLISRLHPCLRKRNIGANAKRIRKERNWRGGRQQDLIPRSCHARAGRGPKRSATYSGTKAGIRESLAEARGMSIIV